PLRAKAEWQKPSPRGLHCQAVNEEVVRNIVALQPAAVVVGGYYDDYVAPPDYLKDFDANVAALRQAGVLAPIFVMGEVPTWSPDVSDLVIDELRAGRKPSEITRDHLQSRSIETDEFMA